jgi:hypothetical protein
MTTRPAFLFFGLYLLGAKSSPHPYIFATYKGSEESYQLKQEF